MEDFHIHAWVKHWSGEHMGYVFRCPCGAVQPELPLAVQDEPKEGEAQNDQQSQEVGDGVGGQASEEVAGEEPTSTKATRKRGVSKVQE